MVRQYFFTRKFNKITLPSLQWLRRLRSGGSAAEKKSLFDTLVGTFVETSEGGSAPPCGSMILTHREAEFHNLPTCGSKSGISLAFAALAPRAGVA